MKTSKEIGEELLNRIGICDDPNCGCKLHRQMLAEYKSAMCREQREVCARLVSGWPTEIYTETEIQDRVADAPEPE